MFFWVLVCCFIVVVVFVLLIVIVGVDDIDIVIFDVLCQGEIIDVMC